MPVVRLIVTDLVTIHYCLLKSIYTFQNIKLINMKPTNMTFNERTSIILSIDCLLAYIL